MSELASKVKCPLCEGAGELSPLIMVEKFSTPELRKRMEERIAEIAEDFVAAKPEAKGKVLNFQREVHNWNTTLPIWRRSAKE